MANPQQRAFGATFGDLIDTFYVAVFLSIGTTDFGVGFQGGGLLGGNELSEDVEDAGSSRAAAPGGLLR